MRERLDQISRIRGLRLTQRYKALSEAQAARAVALVEFRRVRDEIEDLRRQRAETGLIEAGQTLTAADFELRERITSAIDGQVRALVRRQIVARRGLDERDKALAAARDAARAAERARDQIDALAGRVAADEARAADLQEELAAETPARPRGLDRGSGP